MQTLQIDQATNKVVAAVSPPTLATPIDGRYHVDVDETKVGAMIGKTYDPNAKTFS